MKQKKRECEVGDKLREMEENRKYYRGRGSEVEDGGGRRERRNMRIGNNVEGSGFEIRTKR